MPGRHQPRQQIRGRDACQPMPFDARRQVVRRREEGRDIHPVRMITVGRRAGLILVRADPQGTPAEQRDGTTGIAAVRVRQPDRDLGESLPQVAFAGRRGLPRRLEDLVRVKRASRAQQLVGQPGRVRAGQREVVRNPGFAGRGLLMAEWSAQRIARAGVPRPASQITIPPHRSGSGSASQPRSSVSKASGRSSCGKCPAPSITCHR